MVCCCCAVKRGREIEILLQRCTWAKKKEKEIGTGVLKALGFDLQRRVEDCTKIDYSDISLRLAQGYTDYTTPCSGVRCAFNVL